jgi:Fe2+ transport system protein FeoA
MVDHHKSGLARLFLRLFSRDKEESQPDRPLRTLRQVPPGACALVADLGALPTPQRESLMAYGLAPGRQVWVLQHAPVTVITVDQTELALEGDLAEQILMQ